MKNNYPIKYALMPIYELARYSFNEFARDYKIGCYIVTKCYLIDEVKKYKQDGTVVINYHVVCPYEKALEKDVWNIEEPSFNCHDGQCTNSFVTDMVFDNLADAITIKEDKNRELLYDELGPLPLDELKKHQKEYEDKHTEKIEYYNQLEKAILANTEYLEITAEPKEQTIIAYDENGIRKYRDSLYFYLKCFLSNNFIVYSVSSDEYHELEQVMSFEKCECVADYNHTPLLINNKDMDATKLVLPDNDEKYLQDGRIIDSIDGEYEIPVSPDLVIYTMENSQDIINSYHYNEKTITLTRNNKKTSDI